MYKSILSAMPTDTPHQDRNVFLTRTPYFKGVRGLFNKFLLGVL